MENYKNKNQKFICFFSFLSQNYRAANLGMFHEFLLMGSPINCHRYWRRHLMIRRSRWTSLFNRNLKRKTDRQNNSKSSHSWRDSSQVVNHNSSICVNSFWTLQPRDVRSQLVLFFASFAPRIKRHFCNKKKWSNIERLFFYLAFCFKWMPNTFIALLFVHHPNVFDLFASFDFYWWKNTFILRDCQMHTTWRIEKFVYSDQTHALACNTIAIFESRLITTAE